MILPIRCRVMAATAVLQLERGPAAEQLGMAAMRAAERPAWAAAAKAAVPPRAVRAMTAREGQARQALEEAAVVRVRVDAAPPHPAATVEQVGLPARAATLARAVSRGRAATR